MARLPRRRCTARLSSLCATAERLSDEVFLLLGRGVLRLADRSAVWRVTGVAAGLRRIASVTEIVMSAPYPLAALPWNESAFEPPNAARTISFHCHKHLQ